MLLAASLSCCSSISAAEFALSPPVSFDGAGDCSAAADVGDGFFVGATDEDNEFRLYEIKGGLQPTKLGVNVEAAVKRALGVEKIKECDLEGAAKIGQLIFWIGSHGRNSEAKEKKERQVLFATKLNGTGNDAKLEIAGKIYTKLLVDLVTHPALAAFELGKAAALAPKEKGALNIESLAADGDKLWIGFRNPKDKANEALLVPLLNPTEIITGGARAKLGDPVTLQLGGLGVRDMVAWDDGFLIIAGDFVDRFEPGAKPSHLFSWRAGTDPQDIGVDFGDLNPEAIVIMRQGDNARILILSDDGKLKRFRGVWLQQVNAPMAGAKAPAAEANSPPAGANVALRSGDIVFQDSSPHSGQAPAIKALTRSNWSHCGIYFKHTDGSALVIDGNGRAGPIPWEKWRRGGEDGRFAAYRLRNQLSDEQLRKLRRAADRYDNCPYDFKFAWGDQEIYCSELIWKAYRDALNGLEVGRVQRLSDFDLRSPLARPLIERPGGWRTIENAEANGNERVVSPQAIADSELLQRAR